MSLNSNRLGASTISLGSLLQCSTTLFCTEAFPNVKSESPLAQLLTIPMCPVTRYQGEKTSTSLSTSPASGNYREQSSFLQTRQNQIPSLLPTWYAFQLFHQLAVYYFLCFKITSWSSQGMELSCSALQSHLKSHVWFGVSQYWKDIKLLENIQRRTKKMVLLLNIFKNSFLKHI